MVPLFVGSNPTVVATVNITKGWYEMTKKEFQKKYPDGLNIQIVAFKKAIHMIMTTREIDKLIAQTKGSERRWLKAFKKAYSEVVTDWDFPFEPYLNGIKSPTLLRDAIAIMCELFKESVYKGENESDK